MTFTHNINTPSFFINGGSIYAETTKIKLLNSNFSGFNTANDGGTIYAINNCNLTITNTDFLNCFAGQNSGGIYLSTLTESYFNTITINNCIAGIDGGCIYNHLLIQIY